jgi:pimeloyl-ACP methyl ester carboxylesterase
VSPAVPPAARNAGRLVLAVVLLVCATLFASSSNPDDPGAKPRPPAAQVPEPSRYPAVASAQPLSRTATTRATNVRSRTLGYCSNGSVDQPTLEATRVIFVVHGNDRQACVVANAVLASATPEQRTRTLVVAPRFPTADDTVNPQTHHYWTFYGWSQGDLSKNVDNQLSSYEVLDELIDRARHLPYVVAGFSGGGQFVARYAAGTIHEPERFIVVNPSSYLYWTADRPGTSRSRLASCPTYNDYRYGLQQLNPYMAAVGPRVLAQRFSERRVTYLLGSADNDPRSGSMDRTCGAMAGGNNRFERGERYWAYLSTVFGPGVHTRHVKQVVPGVGHHPFRMFAAPAARQALFG